MQRPNAALAFDDYNEALVHYCENERHETLCTIGTEPKLLLRHAHDVTIAEEKSMQGGDASPWADDQCASYLRKSITLPLLPYPAIAASQ